MKIQWLEKYAQEGLVSEETLANIYKDVTNLIKTAGKDAVMQELMMALAGGLAIGAGEAGMSMFTKKIEGKMDESGGRKALLAARNDVVDMYAQDQKAKARARFDEIAMIAPHVAMNKPLITKLVNTKLENGLSDEDTQRLALIQASHMPNVLKNKSYMPKLAEISPQKHGEIVADIFLIKEAGAIGFSPKISDLVKRMAALTGIPLLVGAGAGVANHLIHKIDQKKVQEELEKSFNRAIELSDSEREPLHDNKEKARMAFNSLVHFAPSVALEPQAARAFMTKIVAFDQGMHIDDIRALSEIQKNVSGSKKPSAFSAGFSTAGDMAGLPKEIGSGIGSVGKGLAQEWGLIGSRE